MTNGFFHNDEWEKTDIPLTVTNNESLGIVDTEGFWQSTDSSKDRQLFDQIVAKIECTRGERVCKETDAEVFGGMLQPNSHEYSISTWTRDGIMADDTDEGSCAIGHRLAINFQSNSVIVTDYPKKSGGNALGGAVPCTALQNAYTYALHGGGVLIPGSFKPLIFYCDREGAGSAILSQVMKFDGDVGGKPYHLWQDDGSGGLPRTERTPDHPCTPRKCEQFMKQKLAEL